MRKRLTELLKNICADEAEMIYSFLAKSMNERLSAKDSNHKIIVREAQISYCSTCGSIALIKNGKTKAGRQKYICKDCSKSYSDTSSTVVCYSKKPYEAWKMFVDCELKCMSLRDTAKEVGISTTTAFSWRHKLHAAVKNAIKDIKLSRTIQLDAIYKSINLKGTKKHNMPRYSKKRTGSAFRGISHHKVCIMSGIDDCDNMFFEIVGLGRESIEHVRSIKGKIEDIDLLITDQAWGYTTISKEWDCRLDQIPTSSYKSPLGNSLADLNSLHRELNNYLTNYQGVSIRHLQGYLDMFVFIKNLKYKYEYEERVLNAYLKAIPTSTTLIVNEISTKPLPIDLKVAHGSYQYGIFS